MGKLCRVREAASLTPNTLLTQARVNDAECVLFFGVGMAYHAISHILNTRTCELAYVLSNVDTMAYSNLQGNNSGSTMER